HINWWKAEKLADSWARTAFIVPRTWLPLPILCYASATTSSIVGVMACPHPVALRPFPHTCCTWFMRSTIIFYIITYPTIGTIIVEYKDRSTRFGWTYITTVMQAQGRRMEA